MENNTDDVQLSALLIPQEKEEVELNVVDEEDKEGDEEDRDKIEETTQNNNENKEERQTILRRIGRVTISIFVYLCVVLPLSYVILIIFKPIQIQISRQNKWAQEWPISTFVVWCLLNAAGFSFVARITEKRINPFKCRDGTYKHIIRLMIATPLIFAVGPIRVLYRVTRLVDFDSLSSDSLSFVSPPHSSHLYSFLFNLVFILSFFVGIQFTYLDYIALFRAAGDKFVSPSLWKSYTKRELSLIIPIVFSIVAIVAWHIYLVISHDLVIWYGLFYLIVALVIVVPTLIFRKTYYLHVHHYFLFGLLIPFFAFPNPISILMMGLVSGVYVEGVARWGMVNIWHQGRTRQYDLA